MHSHDRAMVEMHICRSTEAQNRNSDGLGRSRSLSLMLCLFMTTSCSANTLILSTRLALPVQNSSYHNDSSRHALFFSPHLRCGVVRFKLNSSPRPEPFSSPGLLLETPWSAQPQKIKGETPLECPTQRLLECPTPEFFGVPNAETPGVPNPRVSL